MTKNQENDDEQEEDEGFDPERMRWEKLETVMGQIYELLDPKLPEPPVEFYPFKTPDGHLMEDCQDRIIHCCFEIQKQAFSNKDRWLARRIMKQCLAEISNRFPDATTMEGFSQQDPLAYQHYFINCAYRTIEKMREGISGREVSLLRGLWLLFIYWLEFELKHLNLIIKRKLRGK